MMNDFLDEDFFGRKDVFFRADGNTYRPTEGAISFPEGVNWQTYVDSRRLEITCGEAPYLVSRYDSETGEIIPPGERVGLLDRKMRVVNENAATQEEWLKWTVRAFQAVYGYEYQGDNLLIARINLFLSFTEYLEDRWSRQATDAELKEIAKIVSRNLWQMDGLRGTIPMGALFEPVRQLSMFDLFEPPKEEPKPCAVYDWRAKKTVPYYAFKEGGKGSMKFDYIIGNPPYQDETLGDNKGFAPPIYDKFMDEAYQISDKVELIHPARFLFNAGSTPKAWNKKMLSDPHFKILFHEQNSVSVFPNTDIKGGIVISYRDTTKDFGEIGVYTVFDELNSIKNKVCDKAYFISLQSIMYSAYSYHFTDKLHIDFPEIKYKEENGINKGRLSKGHDYDLKSNVFDSLQGLDVFFETKPTDRESYIQILGLSNNERVYRFIRREYITETDNLDFYKVFLAKANGSGALGEVMSTPLIGSPLIGSTESFISIGKFNNREEAENTEKYIKTKFARCLLGILKTTQDITPAKWAFVPLQDFTSISDIDWTQSISEIDGQLYQKYGLSPDEIAFIESHVKEME
ncbi:MAG: Eco57I restriction-modification methylase domain-containing protein [Clostridia bacterium]|nr:Eco57I restriction-modification methylase domain-containing protein [Clostridia bacterium]